MRRAFTLIELLVVIAIIAVLVGMIVPAVQLVRQSAARTQCGNNLHNLALSAFSYHDEFKRFPSGINLPVSNQEGAVFPHNALFISGKIALPPVPKKFFGWPTALLPYYEQEGLLQFMDLTMDQYSYAAGEKSIAAQIIWMLICPADTDMDIVFKYPSRGNIYCFGMNSYGGNGGTRSWYVDDMTTDGIFYINSSVRIEQITDGASNTLLFGERHHYDPHAETQEYLKQGGWAWANYDAGQDYLLSTPVPVNFYIGEVGIPTQEASYDRVCAFGSGHPGGANFAMCDGSIRFLTLVNNSDLPLLQALSTRAGGEAESVPAD